MTPAGLTVRAVVDRGDFTLDVAFEAQPGQVLGVLGPNGAGKTTLLRTLAGLTALTDGRIALAGTPLDDTDTGGFVPAEERPVGLVFQNYRLFPHLTVRDNVAFSARARRIPRREARRQADGWLGRLGLAGLADRKPDQLSGGQAQRVALARALAADPGLLLLDEPLAALDAGSRLEVRGELRRHLADFPGPTLVVTHDPLDAMILADRLLVIEDGRIVQHDTPVAVARRPATAYVAGLVGLNLYAGTVQAEGAGPSAPVAVRLDAGPVFTAYADPRPCGGRTLVAVRPAAITVHTEPPGHASSRNVWRGTVAGLEQLADRVRVQVDGAPPAVVDVTADAVADLALGPGMPVWLSAKATDLASYPAPTTPGDPGG